MQKANWNDVILDDELKTLVQSDVDNFFKSEKIFKDLAVPWKRGMPPIVSTPLRKPNNVPLVCRNHHVWTAVRCCFPLLEVLCA